MIEDKDLLSIQEVRAKVEKAYSAWLVYRTFSQERIDAVVERMAAVARANAKRLADMAVEETGYGNVQDKYIKHLLCADRLPRQMRGMKTFLPDRVNGEEGGLATFALDGMDARASTLFIAAQHGHFRSRLAETLRNRPSQRARRSNDHRHLSGQIE